MLLPTELCIMVVQCERQGAPRKSPFKEYKTKLLSMYKTVSFTLLLLVIYGTYGPLVLLLLGHNYCINFFFLIL